MTDYDENWNDVSLIAWNQWKDICSICGCPDESQRILKVEVARAFKRKIRSVVGNQLDSLFAIDYGSGTTEKEEDDVLPSQSGHLPTSAVFYNDEAGVEAECQNRFESEVETFEQDGASRDGEDVSSKGQDEEDESDMTCRNNDWRMFWAHEFDCGIIEKAKSPKSPKNYKDHTWECIKRSNDPPLKVIRGQLLGKHGIINEIADRYLQNNHEQLWRKMASLQSPQWSDEGDDNPETLEDTLPHKETSSRDTALDQTDKKFLRESFWNLFSNDNAAIFLVYLTRYSPLFPRKLSIASPELQSYVGVDSFSPLYDRLNNIILPKLQTLVSKESEESEESKESKESKERLQVMSVPGTTDFLIYLLIEQIKPEKKAFYLLQWVFEAMSESTEGEN